MFDLQVLAEKRAGVQSLCRRGARRWFAIRRVAGSGAVFRASYTHAMTPREPFPHADRLVLISEAKRERRSAWRPSTTATSVLVRCERSG